MRSAFRFAVNRRQRIETYGGDGASIRPNKAMDLKIYYQKLRKLEREIPEEHLVVVSQETPDGGRADHKTEVTRSVAAMMILEGRARVATKEEAAQFYKTLSEQRRLAEQAVLAERVQVNVISDADVRAIRGALKPEKQ